METCTFRHSKCVVLMVVFLKSVAGTFTPTINMDNTMITGTYYSAHTADAQEATFLSRELTTSTTVYIRESIKNSSPSKITDIPPRASEREQSLTETRTATDPYSIWATDTESWTSQGNVGSSTEVLSSNTESTTNRTTEGQKSTIVHTTHLTSSFSEEPHPVTEARSSRDSRTADNKVWVTDTQSTDTISDTDSIYLSTTISRAGERTLLSVPFNSTSPYTDDSNSSETAPHTFTSEIQSSGPTQNRESTESASSTGVDQVFTSSGTHLPTNTTQERPTETERFDPSQGTAHETGEPNVTGQSFDVTTDGDNPDITPPLTVVVNSPDEKTDVTVTSHTTGGETSFTEDSSVSVSSVPPLVSSEDSVTNASRPGAETSVTRVGVTRVITESSTGSVGTRGREEPEWTQTHHVDDTTLQGLTTAPPTLRDDVTTGDSSSRFFSLTPRTAQPTVPTEVLSTAEDRVTRRPVLTEQDTYRVTTAETPTSTPTTTPARTRATTTPPSPSATTQKPQPSTVVQPHTTPVTTETAQTTQQFPTSRTRGPQTARTSKTDVTTLHLETSTATPGNTTAQTAHTTALYSKSTSASSSRPAALTPGTHRTKGTTEMGSTPTTQTHVKSTPSADHACGAHRCANGGTCAETPGAGYSCRCLPAWGGPSCTEDVDECQSRPCPPNSVCVNTRGSFSCECPLGFDLEDGRTCTQVKTFLGTFRVNSTVHLMNVHEIQREILQLLNSSLSSLRGYRRSTLKQQEGKDLRFLAANMFSVSADVTSPDVSGSIQVSLRNCSKSSSHCGVKLHHQLSYHVESLCLAQNTSCDPQHSLCTDTNGTPYCQCLPGYFKNNPEDMTCRDCGDGFKLVNGTCVECMFGFGGFNCNNFYKLIAVVVSPAGGVLLLIVIIALIVTCCKKDKNDINKIIFKSGDLQMSPYSDFPKSNRVSMEWGRETIEMQENGSTKNLLQMTDIYYSPALRNSDLDRNGLYPFSGLPGSRHSCIYPAQWNPSFISDDSRRRDYF
ncbi:protein HEG [Chanos chanos]|uniref:Protein HEG n=1 Tax=Chanos chanos TaxID=29144 RepID=A0A6J2WHZ1_CHACN|nr:protein HEG homolog 1 [Chanos chanos]